ncbi:MAG: amidohydrolase family protein [Bacteroidota bacterium]
MNRIIFALLFSLYLPHFGFSQQILLLPDRIFDGIEMYESWSAIVEGEKIVKVGPTSELKKNFTGAIKELNGMTLMPGMIEGHSHILLHPYDETSWTDQVLKESIAERSVRAANHLKANLMAGFTTLRDLGSEGAGYADIGLKQAVEKGVIPGPRLLVAGPAIVVTGSYGPKGFAEHVQVPLGAIEADGVDGLIKEVRRQIGGGADVVKVYADYRWGPFGQAMPTFTVDELKRVVAVASSSGRPVVAHAATAEGMRRATLAGVQTIEHGDAGTQEVFELMAQEGVALCPTLAAGDAIMQYRGWNKGVDPDPERIVNKKRSFKLALEAGVRIVAGGDVGVFTHGDNARELIMMVEYGMSELDVLQSVTSVNANVLGLEGLGKVETGYWADLVAVKGNPLDDINALKEVGFVMKNGDIISLKSFVK